MKSRILVRLFAAIAVGVTLGVCTTDVCASRWLNSRRPTLSRRIMYQFRLIRQGSRHQPVTKMRYGFPEKPSDLGIHMGHWPPTYYAK